MYFAIYHNGAWVDLSDDIIGSVVIQERIDQAFGSGSAQAITNKLSYNIPPYTLAHIGASSTDYIQYVVSSEATKYLSMPTYYSHQITIMSIEALMECYVLGTKALSRDNTSDYTKIQRNICRLLSLKYSITLTINSQLSNILNQVGNEYIFGSGATLWSIMLEICSKYDTPYKPTCSVDVANNTINIDIKQITNSYSLTESQILNETISQNSEDYGLMLETEATNVVDRDSEVTFKALTCRSDEVGLTEDNAKIILPTNVEGITSVVADGYVLLKTTDFNARFNTIMPLNHQIQSNFDYIAHVSLTEAMTYDDWQIAVNGVYYNPIKYLYDNFYKNYGIDPDLEYTFTTHPNIVPPYTELTFNGVLNFRLPIDLTSRTLESDVWNGKTAEEKAQLALYSKGGNSISNLNGNYVVFLFGDGNVFDAVAQDYALTYGNRQLTFNPFDDGSGTTINTGNESGLEPSNNPSEHTYDVTCVPITAPKIIDYKNGTPINENSYKRLSRTYNNTANPIDFNKLIKNMDESNEQLGKPELTLEYDLTLPQHPSVGNKITRNSRFYYLMSIQKTYSANSIIAQLNLCESYYKIADAIGVAYQFESTKYPINSIVTRPIFNSYKSTTDWNLIHDNEYGILIKLTTYYELLGIPTPITSVIKRATVMTAGDDYYLYVEAIDQYSFDTQSLSTSAAGAKREIRDITYTLPSKIAISYQLDFIYMQEPITKEMSETMPNDSALSGKSYIQRGDNMIRYLYKDARERLTFTAKISKETE